MESFKDFYDQNLTRKQRGALGILGEGETILEGGNAIKSSTRINQENVEATLADVVKRLLPKLKITKKDIASLGSTGKKAPGGSSGDMDLGVCIKAILNKNADVNTIDDIMDLLVKVGNELSHEVKDMRQFNLISMAWPIANIDGKQENQFVQLDLMATDCLNWSKWAYYSPSEWESDYKGLYRNEILYAIARYMDYKTLETGLTKDGEEVDAVYSRNFFDLAKGLLKGVQSRLGKRGKVVKALTTLNKELMYNDPEEVVKVLFGPSFTPSQMLTWEDALSAVTSDDFIYKDKLDDIMKMTIKGIKDKGYPIPTSLDPWT
jgi:hypothetical protein